jgi:hypothetical protein
MREKRVKKKKVEDLPKPLRINRSDLQRQPCVSDLRHLGSPRNYFLLLPGWPELPFLTWSGGADRRAGHREFGRKGKGLERIHSSQGLKLEVPGETSGQPCQLFSVQHPSQRTRGLPTPPRVSHCPVPRNPSNGLQSPESRASC